jgi:D-alanine-D-alanine ligase
MATAAPAQAGGLPAPHRCRRDLPVLLLHNMDGSWTAAEQEEAAQDVATLADAMRLLGHPLRLLAIEDERLDEALADYSPENEIVFNWCEALPGKPRSEPEVAGILEARGFAYTGSPPATLALAYDKPAIKRLLDARQVPTPRWAVHTAPPAPGAWSEFPAIVKTAHEHCSVGIAPESVVTCEEELRRRVAYVLERHGQPALVETFVDGREFHVSVWGNGRLSMLPAAEMDYCDLSDIRDRLFTYDAKYLPGSPLFDAIKLRVPAELSAAENAALRRIVFDTYRACGCRDYGRIDVRLRDGVFYVLDVNPNPDINPLTSMTYAAAEAGYEYGEMGSLFVNLAAARHPVLGRRQPRSGR